MTTQEILAAMQRNGQMLLALKEQVQELNRWTAEVAKLRAEVEALKKTVAAQRPVLQVGPQGTVYRR